MQSVLRSLQEILQNAVSSSYELFKIMIPIIILIKVLQEMDLIVYMAWPLEPVMELVGLPAQMGLVWAATILNNIYTGLIVLTSLTTGNHLSMAQATILGVLMLIAHGLPVECAIARKTGARFLFQVVMRLLGALLFAWLLHGIFSVTGTMQAPAHMLFSPDKNTTPSLWSWTLSQLKNLLSIFCIITSLTALMRFLNAIGVIALINRVLRPLLRLIGIGPKASAITVIGLTMGLSYGGGLIIGESKSGSIDKKDIFYSLTFMGLCHSVIEDTLLTTLMGGQLAYLLWGRFLFSFLVMAVIVQVVRRLPEKIQNRYLWVNK